MKRYVVKEWNEQYNKWFYYHEFTGFGDESPTDATHFESVADCEALISGLPAGTYEYELVFIND